MIAYGIAGAIILLFPVASYLLYLATINNRPGPTMIAGPWDFVGVLLATSGFSLVGGPYILWNFHRRWRPAFVQGEMAELASGDWSFLWVLLWLAYFLLVLGAAAFFLWRRRAYTNIYNMEPALLDELLGHVFARLGLEAGRIGHRIAFRQAVDQRGPDLSEAIQPAAEPGLRPVATNWARKRALLFDDADEPGLGLTLEIDPFVSLRNVVLRWRGDNHDLRYAIESELARHLAAIECPENPAAGWLLTIASCLFGTLFLLMVGLLLFLMQAK